MKTNSKKRIFLSFMIGLSLTLFLGKTIAVDVSGIEKKVANSKLSLADINSIVGTLKNIFNDDGNVGIGTTNPTQKLEVTGNIKASGRNLYLGENLLYSDNSSALISRSNHDTATQITLQDLQGKNYGRVYGDGDGQHFGLLDGDYHWSYLASKNNYTQFLINNSAKMTILNNGNVGIGTTNPTRKLEVTGNIKASGTVCDSNGCIGSSTTNLNVYKCPNQEHCNDGQLIMNGDWVSIGCVGQISTTDYCDNVWWDIPTNSSFRCTNQCSYAGKMMLK